MIQEKVQLKKKEADGYVIPLGPANLVLVATDVGAVFCGAFDVSALDKFDYPAARVKPTWGDSIQTIKELLRGEVVQVNKKAAEQGLEIGMMGKEALDLM